MNSQTQNTAMTSTQDMTTSGNPIFGPPTPTWSDSDFGGDQTQSADHIAAVSPPAEPQIDDSRVTNKSHIKVITAPVAVKLTKEDKEDGQFTMEYLLDSRIVKRKGKLVTEYLVSWAGNWSKKLKTSWSVARDIDPAEIAYFEATRPKKTSGSKAVDDFVAKGMQPLFDLEAKLGGSDSDDESALSGEDFEPSDEESEGDDEGSEYSPDIDEMEIDADPSNHKSSDNDVSESNSDDTEVDSKAPKKEVLKEESSDDSSDSEEEDADGEEISQEEQDLLAKKSIFNKK